MPLGLSGGFGDQRWRQKAPRCCGPKQPFAKREDPTGRWLLGKPSSPCEAHCAKGGLVGMGFLLVPQQTSLVGLHRLRVTANWGPGCPWAPPRGIVPACLAARWGNSPPTFLRCFLLYCSAALQTIPLSLSCCSSAAA